MKTQMLVERHAKDIKGVIECFDRGCSLAPTRPTAGPGRWSRILRGRGTSFMEFNKIYANQLNLEVAEHVRVLARAK